MKRIPLRRCALDISADAGITLNRPKNVLEDGRSNHVLHIFQIIPAGPQRFISPGQGAGPGSSQGSSRIPLHPIGYIRGKLRVRNQFSSRHIQTTHFLSSTRRTRTPCWRPPWLLGCQVPYFCPTFVSCTFCHHHLQQPVSRGLPLLTTVHEALRGHLKVRAVGAFGKVPKETSVYTLKPLSGLPPSLVILTEE